MGLSLPWAAAAALLVLICIATLARRAPAVVEAVKKADATQDQDQQTKQTVTLCLALYKWLTPVLVSIAVYQAYCRNDSHVSVFMGLLIVLLAIPRLVFAFACSDARGIDLLAFQVGYSDPVITVVAATLPHIVQATTETYPSDPLLHMIYYGAPLVIVIHNAAAYVSGLVKDPPAVIALLVGEITTISLFTIEAGPRLVPVVAVGASVGAIALHALFLSRRLNTKLAAELEQEKKQAAVLKDILSGLPGVVCFESDNPGSDEHHVRATGDIEGVLGYTREEWLALPQPFRTVLSGESKAAVLSTFKAMHADPESTVSMLELRHVKRDGTPAWMRLDKMSRLLQNGNALIVLHDISAEVALREMTQKRDTQKADAERFKYACGFLSHEIRNQLYPQAVALDNMLTADADADAGVLHKWRADIETMQAANTTVSSILNRVLDLAKWEAGKFPVEKKCFPLARLCKSIAGYATSRHRKDAPVEIVGLEDIPENLRGDGDEEILKQAATNLVSNADKFRAKTPLIVTFACERTTEASGVFAVEVRDGGRGLTPSELEKAMVPFAQVRKAGDQEMGTGLGLPLTKEMIESGHGGAFTLASDGPGKGCTATMSIPMPRLINVGEPVAAPSDPLDWVVLCDDPTADVLVVDDSRIIRKTLVRIAKGRFKLTVAQAGDGLEALHKMATGRFSIVFMDNRMPQLNGDEATARARAQGYAGPIALVSGETFQPSEKAEIKEKGGFTAVLSKMDTPGAYDAMKRLAVLKKREQQRMLGIVEE